MNIEEIRNKRVKISPHSITVKDEYDKTRGIVRNTILYTAELKKIYALAYEKQQELEKLCSQFNALVVDGIENIYSITPIYKNWC